MPILGVIASSRLTAVPDTFELISTSTISGSTTESVTFSNLDTTYGATYKQLQLRVVMKNIKTAGDDANNLGVRINGGTTSANYLSQSIHAYGGSNQTAYQFTTESFLMYNNIIPANTSNLSNMWGVAVIDFLDPFSSTQNKVAIGHGGYATGYSTYQKSNVGKMNYYTNTAISSITVGCEYNATYYLLAGTRISLYGIRGS
jgi:hypothetical protein